MVPIALERNKMLSGFHVLSSHPFTITNGRISLISDVVFFKMSSSQHEIKTDPICFLDACSC